MVILNTLTLHLHTCNRLVLEQFGFRIIMSIAKGVIKLTGSTFKCINQEKYVQAFSTIWPRILTV